MIHFSFFLNYILFSLSFIPILRKYFLSSFLSHLITIFLWSVSFLTPLKNRSCRRIYFKLILFPVINDIAFVFIFSVIVVWLNANIVFRCPRNSFQCDLLCFLYTDPQSFRIILRISAFFFICCACCIRCARCICCACSVCCIYSWNPLCICA